MIEMLLSFSVCYFKKNMVYVNLTFGKFTKPGIKKWRAYCNSYNILNIFVLSSILFLREKRHHSLNMNAAHVSNRNIDFCNCTCLNFQHIYTNTNNTWGGEGEEN